MRFITAIGQRWKKALGASLTIALLSAVAVVGITLFGSEVLAAWKTPGNAEQALTSSGLLNFDAPAATVARIRTETEEAKKGQASSDALLAKNWKYTQTILDYLKNPLLIYTEGLQLELLTSLFQTFLPNSPFTAFVTSFTQAWVTTANGLLTTVLHLPPLPPPASPFS